MSTWERIVLVSVLVLVPIVPSYILYYAFGELSFAKVLGEGIVLGGPIAAYFVIMCSSYRMFVGLGRRDDAYRYRLRKKMSNLLAGRWSYEVTAQSDKGVHKVSGSAEIGLPENGDDDMTISGHWLDEGGKPSGAWSADEVVFTHKKLIFIYSVPAVDGHSPCSGLTNLNIVRDPESGEVEGMEGHWGILGRNVYGTISWRKKS